MSFQNKSLKYLDSGELDVVCDEPGQTVTHEEDHHVPPKTQTHSADLFPWRQQTHGPLY